MITINNVTVTVNQILVEVDKETFNKSVQGKLEQPAESQQAQAPVEAPAKRTRRTKEEIQAAEQPSVTETTAPSRILPAEHVESPSRRSFEEEQPTRAFEPPARRSFSDETTAPEPPATGRRRSFSDETTAPEPPATGRRRSFSDETTAPEPPATGRRRSFSDDAKAPTESQQSTAPTRRSYAD